MEGFGREGLQLVVVGFGFMTTYMHRCVDRCVHRCEHRCVPLPLPLQHSVCVRVRVSVRACACVSVRLSKKIKNRLSHASPDKPIAQHPSPGHRAALCTFNYFVIFSWTVFYGGAETRGEMVVFHAPQHNFALVHPIVGFEL